MSFSDGRQDILFSIKAEPQGVAGPGQGKCVLGEALPGKAEECQTRGGRRSRGKLRAWRSGRRPGRGESGLGRTGAPAQLEEGAGGRAEADLLGRGPEVSQRGPLRRRGSGGQTCPPWRSHSKRQVPGTKDFSDGQRPGGAERAEESRGNRLHQHPPTLPHRGNAPRVHTRTPSPSQGRPSLPTTLSLTYF